MSFPIELYTFKKANNSTSRPVGSGMVYEGLLHEPCSMLTPSVKFKFSATFSPAEYNYCYIRAFKKDGDNENSRGRFYFINNWVFSHGFWIAECSIDALASWRNEIGEMTEYILRSSQKWDGRIVDTFYPTKGLITEAGWGISDVWTNKFENGFYVLGIVGGRGLDRVGCVNYYIMDASQLIIFMNWLFSNNYTLPLELTWNSTNSDGLLTNFILNSNELTKNFFNPFQYIVSCNWFPFSFDSTKFTITHDIAYGWWTTSDPSVSAYVLPQTKATRWISKRVPVPKHPQIDETNRNYLTLSPYSEYTLSAGCFGVIPIPSERLMNTEYLGFDLVVDYISGEATLYLSPSTESVLGAFYQSSAMIAVPIQISQMNRDYLSLAEGGLSAISSTVSKIGTGDIFGGLANAASGIGSAMHFLTPQFQTKGTNGSSSAYLMQPFLHAYFTHLVDEDLEHSGRPLCQKMRIDTLGQYMQVLSPHVNLACTEGERDIISNYMERGFYWQ